MEKDEKRKQKEEIKNLKTIEKTKEKKLIDFKWIIK